MSATSSFRPRHVTALVLGRPSVSHGGNWMEIAPDGAGAVVVSEAFARRRLPPPALAALRSQPCFYICVDDVSASVAHVPGRRVGEAVIAHGMRELCVETANGMVVLAERA